MKNVLMVMNNIKRKVSKRRQEMGEEKWAEYQQIRKSYKANICKKKNVISVVNFRRMMKIRLIEYKGGKCEICAYNKPFVSCYDFHHIDPSQKEFRIADGVSRKWEIVKKEVDKCQLLCRNCHSELHDRENTIKRELNKNKILEYELQDPKFKY